MIDSDKLFSPFVGHEGSIISFVMLMQQYALSPADVLLLYEQYMAALQADMQAPPLDMPTPESDPDTRRIGGQADTEYRLGACPRCGEQVWGIKKCPHISPPWRTFFACDNEVCSFHGRSRLSVPELRLSWPTGVEED